jgi:hypothetical protein
VTAGQNLNHEPREAGLEMEPAKDMVCVADGESLGESSKMAKGGYAGEW